MIFDYRKKEDATISEGAFLLEETSPTDGEKFGSGRRWSLVDLGHISFRFPILWGVISGSVLILPDGRVGASMQGTLLHGMFPRFLNS